MLILQSEEAWISNEFSRFFIVFALFPKKIILSVSSFNFEIVLKSLGEGVNKCQWISNKNISNEVDAEN